MIFVWGAFFFFFFLFLVCRVIVWFGYTWLVLVGSYA